MPIEYVPDYDDNGVDQGGHTESVPDMGPGKEEPDCHSCNDGGCPDCGRIDPADPEHQKYVAAQIIQNHAGVRSADVQPTAELEICALIPHATAGEIAAIKGRIESARVTVIVEWPDANNPGPWSTEQPF